MSQIETAVFVRNLPAGLLPRLFLAGVVAAVPFSYLAVLILGRRRAHRVAAATSASTAAPAAHWMWKLGVIMIAYVVIYFGFGYFVAWRNPDLRAYYGGIDEGGFFAQMAAVLANQSWLVPLQMAQSGRPAQ